MTSPATWVHGSPVGHPAGNTNGYRRFGPARPTGAWPTRSRAIRQHNDSNRRSGTPGPVPPSVPACSTLGTESPTCNSLCSRAVLSGATAAPSGTLSGVTCQHRHGHTAGLSPCLLPLSLPGESRGGRPGFMAKGISDDHLWARSAGPTSWRNTENSSSSRAWTAVQTCEAPSQLERHK